MHRRWMYRRKDEQTGPLSEDAVIQKGLLSLYRLDYQLQMTIQFSVW